jgi:ABC-type transport system involved in multi-copper enzyme maturation permease subunit
MRGGRVFIAMGIYISILSLVAGTLIILAFIDFSARGNGIRGQDYATIGREIVTALTFVQMCLIVVFSPGLTCASFSGEFEQRTFEAMALSSMSSRTIVLGKFVSSLCYLALLLFCSLPVLALTFLFGGVSPIEILFVYLACLTIGLFFGSLGLLASAMVRRTFISTGLAYGFMLFWIVGLPASASSSVGMFLFGGLTIAGILTVLARWLLPRMRKGWRPERVVYIAIFGLSYCMITAVLLNNQLTDRIDSFLQGSLDALGSLLFMSTGHNGPLPFSGNPTTFNSLLVSAVLFMTFALAGMIAALLATLSIIRAMRAPIPDSYEIETRLAHETHNTLSTGEAL